MLSDAASTFRFVGALRRFSAQELEDDASPFSSDELDTRLTFREWNAQQNRMYELGMRDFRRLVDIWITSATDRRQAVVYFVQAWGGGPIKIGSSSVAAVDKRLTALQIGNPAKLEFRRIVAGDWRIERALHSYFREQHVRGEWFEPEGELIEVATRRSNWGKKHGPADAHRK